MRIRRTTLLKIAVACLWVGVIAWSCLWFRDAHVPLRHIPRLLLSIIHAYGLWGPVIIFCLHALRALFLLPTTALALIAGSLYGPVWGTVLTIIGENISASIGFLLGRFFGRRYVKEHEHGWVRKYDDLLTKEGFFTILAMRLLFFPFDVVNYLSGMTGITYRQYLFGTLLGLLPAIVTITVLGGAFGHPIAWVVFGILCVITIAIVVLLRRSSWVKEKLFAKRPEHVI